MELSITLKKTSKSDSDFELKVNIISEFLGTKKLPNWLLTIISLGNRNYFDLDLPKNRT